MGAGKAADLTYWEGAARTIAANSSTSKIVVEKSTVPVKTAQAISKVGSSCGCGYIDFFLSYSLTLNLLKKTRITYLVCACMLHNLSQNCAFCSFV